MSDNNVIEIPETKTIYDLQLHETVDIEGAIVMRVPGGWLYSMVESFQDANIVLPPVFVPFTAEGIKQH